MKIQLSPEEMQLVSDTHWILTKHRIIEKVYELFGRLAAQMQQSLAENNHTCPVQAVQQPPKISKGEQYEALPYVVLDYPRLFSREDVYAIRSFFWWGHYFSISLHLKGKYLTDRLAAIEREAAAGKWNGFYFSDAGNEFSFNLDDFSLIDPDNPWPERQTQQPAFFKISYKLCFHEWETAEQKLLDVFERFNRMGAAL